MSDIDRRILFLSLGFMAVLLQDTPRQNQAIRAVGIAKLIEEFCRTSLPAAFGKAELPGAGAAHD